MQHEKAILNVVFIILLFVLFFVIYKTIRAYLKY